MKSIAVVVFIGISLILFSFAIQTGKDNDKYVAHTLNYIKQRLQLFTESTNNLQIAVSAIRKNDSTSIPFAKKALKNSRIQYKSIEFFLTYFFRSNAALYNESPNFEVEEPYLEYEPPTGFQVIEGILFSDTPFDDKGDLVRQAKLLHSSASDIHSYLYNLKINDKQILESIRLGIVRVIALGITGFDAPELKTGISEAGKSLKAFEIVLQPLFDENSVEADSVSNYFDVAIGMIQENSDFDSFDRVRFLTKIIFPLQRHLDLLIVQKGLDLNTTGVLNYHAKNLFSAKALFIDPESNPYNVPVFPTDSNAIHIAMHSYPDKATIALGRRLFFEKSLSGNNTRSCAGCHHPEKYFTDGLLKAFTLDGGGKVKRNTPSLLYVSYQYSQFWDGRAGSLKNQIETVLKNPKEMNADLTVVLNRLNQNQEYVDAFNNAFPDAVKDSLITIGHLTQSIAGYLKTLAPFASSFDRFMNGDYNAISPSQKRGFNLFLGKAQCATCHFTPLFNGLLPPFYDMTELENLGVTRDINFANPHLDEDSGRFSVSPAQYFMRKFKTPGLRNIAKTAPYMHNGVFPDLESVLDFYNKGGGEGVGLNVPNQTLSSRELKLTDPEIKDIINFLNSLTEEVESISK